MGTRLVLDGRGKVDVDASVERFRRQLLRDGWPHVFLARRIVRGVEQDYRKHLEHLNEQR